MALHTKGEFAKLCGKDSAYISMYVKRGKLIAQKDKKGQEWIDDTLEVNKSFMKRWQQHYILNPKEKPKPTDAPKAAKATSPKPQAKKAQSKKSKSKTHAALEIDRHTESDFKKDVDIEDVDEDTLFAQNLNQREQVLRIRKLEEEGEIKRLQKEKLLGLNIPIAEVKLIFGQTFTSFSAHFREASEDITEILCARLGGGAEVQNDLKLQLESVINEAVDKAKEDSRKALKLKTEEYTQKRGRGESKIENA